MPTWLTVLIIILGSLFCIFIVTSIYCSCILASRADSNLEKILLKKRN